MKIYIYEINTKSGKILINFSIEAEFFHYCSDHVFQCNFCFITQTKNVKDWKHTLTWNVYFKSIQTNKQKK